MTKPTPKQVLKIARLAKLEIDPKSLKKHQANLAKVLDFVAIINEIDTTKITPFSHPDYLSLNMREDLVTALDQYKILQNLSLETQAGFYLVPKVLNMCDLDEHNQ